MWLLQNLLSHLVLASIAPEHTTRTRWLMDVGTFQSQLRNRITPALMAPIELDHLRNRSVSEALAKAGEIGAHDPAGESTERHALSDQRCPFTLRELCADDFDPQAMANRPAITVR